MRKQFYIIIAFLSAFALKAQQTIVVHNSGNNMFASSTSAVDSIKLDANYSKFKLSGNTTILDIPKTAVDSITFTSNTVNLTKIYIIYKGKRNNH